MIPYSTDYFGLRAQTANRPTDVGMEFFPPSLADHGRPTLCCKHDVHVQSQISRRHVNDSGTAFGVHEYTSTGNPGSSTRG